MIKSILLSFSILLFVNQMAFSSQPDRSYILTPDSVGWSYEEIIIETDDNHKLNSWIYQPNKEKDKKTVLVMAYADAGNMSYYVYHAVTLAHEGYTVVTFDYRGYGKSSDFEIDQNMLYYMEFCKDLEAVVYTMDERFEGSRMGIWAMSMGTTITSRSFATLGSRIDFIIGEGFVTDTANIVERIKVQKEKEIHLPEPSKNFTDAVKRIDLPLLIIGGSEDQITTVNDAIKLKEAIGESCTIVEYKGDHLRGFQFKIKEMGFGKWYIGQINDFLDNISE